MSENKVPKEAYGWMALVGGLYAAVYARNSINDAVNKTAKDIYDSIAKECGVRLNPDQWSRLQKTLVWEVARPLPSTLWQRLVGLKKVALAAPLLPFGIDMAGVGLKLIFEDELHNTADISAKAVDLTTIAALATINTAVAWWLLERVPGQMARFQNAIYPNHAVCREARRIAGEDPSPVPNESTRFAILPQPKPAIEYGFADKVLLWGSAILATIGAAALKAMDVIESTAGLAYSATPILIIIPPDIVNYGRGRDGDNL